MKSTQADAKSIKCLYQKFNETESTKQLLIHGNKIMVECQNTGSVDEILDVIYKYTNTVLQKNSYRSDKKTNVVNDEGLWQTL